MLHLTSPLTNGDSLALFAGMAALNLWASRLLFSLNETVARLLHFYERSSTLPSSGT